jgi:methionyl-tRNA formyltransferase
MRVVYFGSGDFAVPTLRWLVNSRHDLLLAVTQPDRPAGRGKALQPTSVAERAAVDGVPTLKCEDVNAVEILEQLKSLQADVGVVAAFGQKLHEPVRSAFREGCINLHASLLPKFRGASPISAAILAGEKTTGVSVFRLVDRMDAGPVLLTRQTAIASTETTGELHDRLAGVCCDAIGAALDLLEKNPDCPGEAQDESLKSYAKKLKKSDGFLRFEEPAERLALQIRAMWPWPAARCRYVPAGSGGKPIDVSVITATAVPITAAGTPGTITPVMTVATGQGTLEVHSVQPAGGRAMSWQEFVNGRRVQPGDRLESVGG